MSEFDTPTDPRVTQPVPDRHAQDRSQLALRFWLLTASVIVSAFGLAWGLGSVLGKASAASPWTMVFHPAFAVSSLLLVAGSFCLSRAVAEVRRERQPEFRNWLTRALVAGALFTAVQSYALWAISPTERGASEASRGVRPFIMVLCTLHALHFLIAIMGLCFVTVRAWADKYDHEYHWGVSVCAGFWHFLGVVWVAVLAVISIAL